MANKADRLREFLRERKEAPLVPIPTKAQWDAFVEAADLTPDDLKLLARQVSGHQERARKAQESGDEEGLAFEATQALALDPVNPEFAVEVAGWLDQLKGTNPEIEALRKRVSLRKSQGRRLSPWVVGATLVTVFLALSVGALVVWHPWTPPEGSVAPAPKTESRNLPVEWSISDIKAEVSVQKSVLEVYAESRVLDLQAIVVLPEVQLGLWVARLTVLDSSGSVLFQNDRELHSVADGPLQPGQGLDVRMTFDAGTWTGEPARVKVETLQMDKIVATPQQTISLPVDGLDALPKGYALSVSQVNNAWKTLFATRSNQLNLELHNTGLRAFRILKFSLEWRDSEGQLLKSSSWNPISEYRTELPSGGHVSAVVETVFETELFPWQPGNEPHPTVRLVTWK